MRNLGMVVIGVFIIFLGAAIGLANLFDINLWSLFWPVMLILLGLALLLGPRLNLSSGDIQLRPLAGVRERGVWQVASQEIWTFVGDIRLDMTEAEIPSGETHLRVLGFVGDIRLVLPAEVGYSIASTAFLTERRIDGVKEEIFVRPTEYKSENYDLAARKIRLETLYFVVDLRVERG